MNFCRFFPCLRTLRLDFFTDSTISPQSPCFNLEGISLHKLVLEDWDEASLVPSIARTLDLSAIAVIEYGVVSPVWTEPMWRLNTDDTLRIRLTLCSSPDMTMHVVPGHRDWRLICHLREWFQSSPCETIDIPRIGTRLTYLRMANICLTTFLECDGLTLAALRALHVDFEVGKSREAMLWPPDWLGGHEEWDVNEVSFSEEDRSAPEFDEESYHYVHCPGLETLTLFALDAPTIVDSQEAAFLGHALSQMPRSQTERASLALVGVEFWQPIVHSLLAQTFNARICRSEFRGRDSPADKDGGLWDYDIRTD